MLFLLGKRRFCSDILPIFAANHNLNLCRCASQSHPKPTNSMMVDYLVASFGFTPDKAARVSKPIAHLNSPDKPEAVRRFFKREGFSDDQLKAIITLRPQLLYASPENTLGPNLRALRDIGLSTSTLTQLILLGPTVLHTSSAASRIKFWRDFFGGDETALVRAFKGNNGLGSRDISANISPKLSLLRSHGLSTHDIQRVVLTAHRLILGKVSSVEHALMRTKEFGFQPESGMFATFLHVMMAVSKEVLQNKMELFKSFGWSEDEFLSALCKAPSMVIHTEKSLQSKMNFFIGEAKCDPSYIASCPKFLTLSLEKRLRPRLHILHLLDSKGFSAKRPSFYSVIMLTNEEFVKRFILPHKMKFQDFMKLILLLLLEQQEDQFGRFKFTIRNPNAECSHFPLVISRAIIDVFS